METSQHNKMPLTQISMRGASQKPCKERSRPKTVAEPNFPMVQGQNRSILKQSYSLRDSQSAARGGSTRLATAATYVGTVT